MKTKLFSVIAIAIITIAIIGCKQDDPPPPQIQREFTDLTLVRGKSITLIDETGGTTDLKARGIWKKFDDAFKVITFGSAAGATFDGIYANGDKVTITVVATGSNYEVNGHEIRLSLSYVNSADSDELKGAIPSLIEAFMVAGEQPQKQPDTPRTLTFGTDCKVTITSDEQFTTAEWTTLCANVVTALETAYEDGSNGTKNRFKNIFEEGVTIVLEINPTDYTNYKVGGETLRILYLNVDSISTANYANAIAAMYSDDPTDINIKG